MWLAYLLVDARLQILHEASEDPSTWRLHPLLCKVAKACSLCSMPLQVILVVKGLVKSGMTICATIHSPTPFTFNLFDYMMILLGGRMIYCGQNGKQQVVQKPAHRDFESHAFIHATECFDPR